jgi:hypothetical protein
MIAFAEENIEGFIRASMILPGWMRELALSWVLLRKTQTSLGRLHGYSQTTASSLLRSGFAAMCCFHLFGGEPQRADIEQHFPESMRKIKRKKRAGWTEIDAIEAACLFAETRSFAEVAKRMGMRRPDVRWAVKTACSQLSGIRNVSANKGLEHTGASPQAQAIAVWLVVIAGRRADARRFTERRITGPDLLGEFEREIASPGFESVFAVRAA